jgi:hypothetical protein
MRITISEDVTSRLKEIQERLAHLQPVLEGPVADSLRASFQAQFWTQGSYFGTPWEPLASSTLRKPRRRSTTPFGTDSDLFRSLTEPGATHTVLEVDDNSLTFGTDAPGAWEAQFGTRHEPPRELVPEEWPAPDTDRIAERIGDYLIGGRS